MSAVTFHIFQELEVCAPDISRNWKLRCEPARGLTVRANYFRGDVVR
jgi:hypothetical protein